MHRIFPAAVVLLVLVSPLRGAGLLAPTDQTLPPLRVTDHLVDVDIHDGVALTTVTQTFRNDTSRRLEATYVFPLPELADLTDFQMSVGGKMVKGKVLPAEEAARIYESIVRQAKDPGLIEFIGRRLLQMRVFPIEPESDTTIQIRYQQICSPVSGMRGYHYPLRTRKTAGQAYGTVRFAVDLETATPLKSIWSPTHAVEIVRGKDERTAKIAYEANGGSLEDDFVLLFDTDSSDLGLSVVAHKPSTNEPGHFVLMLTPKQLWPDEAHEPQDVAFIVDTSGSMAGEKIGQARRALAFCINRLDEKDRFTVVRFSTGFDVLFDELVEASDERKTEATRWIEQFEAAGGTNIADALRHVVRLDGERALREDRPFVVVFLTDGRGNRGPEEIMNLLADEGDGKADPRIFPFGVGHDVNTKLLDRLSDTYSGKTTYVQPGQDLELVLGDFFSVISRPVLTDLRLVLPGIQATDRFPATLGDLYHGQQLVVAGRFGVETTGSVRLVGRRRGEDVEYVWKDVAFTSTDGAGYVAPVWAGRKIAYLIDQIRRHGESTEMVQEILVLSQRYGIQTPYTSWLVDPERRERVIHDHRFDRRSGGVTFPWQRGGAGRASQGRSLRRAAPGAGVGFGSGGRGGSGGGGGGALFGEPDGQGSQREGALHLIGGYGDDFDEIDGMLAAEAVTESSGRVANLIARKNAAMREFRSRDEGRLGRDVLLVRRIGERWYNRFGRGLVDAEFGEDTQIVVVRFASEAYFELVRRRPDLRPVLAAAREVVVMVSGDVAILVSDRVGAEQFSDEQREQTGLATR